MSGGDVFIVLVVLILVLVVVGKVRKALHARQSAGREEIDATFADHLQSPAATPENELESLLQELSSLTAPDEMPRRIAICRKALALINRNDQPEVWATAHVELGDSLRQNPRGDRAQNIEEAISRYEQALEVYTQEDFPEEWAMTQGNLANAYDDRIRGDKADNIEEVIRHNQLALEVFTREDFPEDWADTQIILAAAYRERIRGDKADNIEEVISCYKQALEVYIREDFPEEWADTQNVLADAYDDRIRGERADNIKQAIFHYEQALEVYTREDFPEEWAATQDVLANAYEESIPGEGAQNWGEVTDAVIAFVDAQRWSDSKRIVEKRRDVLLTGAADEVLAYLLTQYRGEERATGILEEHRTLLGRCRREGIDAAFADRLQPPAATPENELESLLQEMSSLSAPNEMPRRIAVCREALAMVDRDEQPEVWAMLQVELGINLGQNPQGDRTDNVEEAISHYGQALEVYTREDFPEEWAITQHNLAFAYSDRIRGERAENLERAISRCESALEVHTRQDFPEEWAATQGNLAKAYHDRIRGERAENLEKAISHCELALEVYTREDAPVEWATIQNSLAAAYHARIRGEMAENIEEAIRHYQLALEVRTREDLPLDWAATQHNLAFAYSERIREDRANNIEEAIFRYKLALEVRTREDFPMDWAMTQNVLAVAYSNRIRGERAENLEEAISRCEQVLEVHTREDFPMDWAMTQHNLAAAYRGRIRGDRAENLEETISHFKQALEVHTRQDFPVEWGATRNGLATAYSNRIRGEKAENLEEAIRHYEQALEVSTREDFPVDWAMIQHNLAAAYDDRIRGDRAENLEEATSCYKLALEVRTPDTFPQDCRNTAYFLGRILYGEGRYAEARVALTTAHEAVEALRAELQREGSKQRLAEENANLYARLVHCCLMEGDEEAAFEYAVAGKGRAFVDMLATARFDLSAAEADDPQLGEALRQARELRQQIDSLLARLGGEGGISPDEDGEQRGAVRSQMQASLRSLQDQEAAHWEEMSYRYPALMATQQAPTLSAEEARALARKLGATLVEYYRHAGGWCAFIVSPEEIRDISLPGVDEIMEDMLGWLEEIESPYGRNEWSYDSLRGLHQAVIAPLDDHLPRGGAVVLAPFSSLHLVPLGAALDPKTERYATEDHLLEFTPNLAALRVALDQGSRQDDSGGKAAYQKLLGVAYPGAPGSDHYLPNVLPEAEAVARHFPDITPLYRTNATPDAVVSRARGQDVVHFGCHGTFDPDAPEQSGLMLSGGWLTVQRVITDLHLDRTKLATIGACLSGRVHVRQAEEHVGLVQAMMSAGARAVVASLWPVNDASTRALFEAFYAGIEAGKSPAVALAEAARMVRERDGWEHPYYWAAFQPTGLAYEGDEPDSARLPDEVAPRMDEARQESIESVRGGSKVDAERIVEDSLSLLRQMKRRPRQLLAVLEDAGEREGVAAGLRALEEQAAAVQTETELLELADAVHRLVEETPALAKRLLPKEMDVQAARQKRWFYLEDAEPSAEDLHVQESKAQMLNDVREIRWEVERSPQEEASQ